MPVPAPNFNRDINVIRLSDVCLRAMEERGHHCVILPQSEEPGTVEVMGFKTFDEANPDRAEAYFQAKGSHTQWVTRPNQGRTLLTSDNHGIPLELYRKMDRLAPIHRQYALYRGVKPLRIDHFNCFSPDVDAFVAFYSDFGFRVTEYTQDEDSQKLWAAWIHRKGGVHDMAFTNGTGPRKHHVAFWVPTPLTIIDLLDLMATIGYVKNIERGPGRHGISNAFISNILDPVGNWIEIYCNDDQTVDPDLEPIKWNLQDPQRQTLWGAPAPESWFKHGSPLMGNETRESQIAASPIVAP